MTTAEDRAEAVALDAEDALGPFRHRFFLPQDRHGHAAIYFAGHSLGPQPFAARGAMEAALDEWAELGVAGWSDGKASWVTADTTPATRSARLVGAHPSEVAVGGTLTGNLHTLLASFYRPTAARHAVLMEARPFPSDRYAVASHIGLHGYDARRSIVEAPSAAAGSTSLDALLETLEREAHRVALVLVGAVNYLTGESFDPAPIVRTAHAHGIPVGVDAAHAVGNVPLSLHDAGVDFGAWCGYKYLNGGPGAPAGLFVHERHHLDETLPRLAGWWGHRLADRFRMPPAFEPAAGAAGWQVSTPSVLALAPLSASLDLFEEAGLDALRRKSVALTGYIERLVGRVLGDRVEIVTPRDPGSRGAQLSLRVRADLDAVFPRLVAADVVCDRREPDILRIAPAALFNTFDEGRRFVDRLAAAIG